jgi:hypothetical protein
MFRAMPNDVHDPERGFPAFAYAGRVPLIAVSHASFEPKFEGRKIVYLARSVSDVLVSFYFHNVKHTRIWSGCLSDFIRDGELGLPRLIRYCNSWSVQMRDLDCHLATYERLLARPADEVTEIVRFLGLPCDRSAVDRAVLSGRFERMQRVESQSGIPGHDYDHRDGEARRVRKGKIGSGLEYLSPADIEFIDRECRTQMNAASQRLYAQLGVEFIAGAAPAARAA